MSGMQLWVTAAAPFVGFSFAFVTEVLRGEQARKAAREVRAADRQESLRDRRETFELEHLLDIIGALGDLGRAMGRVHHLDLTSGKASGQYAATLLPEEDSTKLMLANRRVRELAGLVLNDDLRELVLEAHRALNVPSSMLRGSPDEAQIAVGRAIEALQQAQDGLAARVRDIYRTPA